MQDLPSERETEDNVADALTIGPKYHQKLNKITEKFIVWKPIPFGTIAKLKLWPKRT